MKIQKILKIKKKQESLYDLDMRFLSYTKITIFFESFSGMKEFEYMKVYVFHDSACPKVLLYIFIVTTSYFCFYFYVH